MEKLNYKDFTITLKEQVEANMNADVNLSLKQVVKNNDLKLDALLFNKKGSNVSPTIYLNPLYSEYEKGISLETIVSKITEQYNNLEIPDFNNELQNYLNYEKVKKRLAIKLVNYEKNKDYLQNVPHIRRLDLAITFQYVVEKKAKEHAAIQIKNSHLKQWNIGLDVLYEDALNNTTSFLPAVCYSLFDSVNNKYSNEPLNLDNLSLNEYDLLILTNESKVCGAATLFYPNILEKISQSLNSDLYIIPSSVHEILICPKNNNIDKDELNKLVNFVNRSEVAPDEILSDSIYIYDSSDRIITK